MIRIAYSLFRKKGPLKGMKLGTLRSRLVVVIKVEGAIKEGPV